jgi:hypothetical protein
MRYFRKNRKMDRRMILETVYNLSALLNLADDCTKMLFQQHSCHLAHEMKLQLNEN